LETKPENEKRREKRNKSHTIEQILPKTTVSSNFEASNLPFQLYRDDFFL